MQKLTTSDYTYLTRPTEVGILSRTLPSLTFYSRFLTEVYTSALRAKRGVYDDESWYASSINVVRGLESVGISFSVKGLEHVAAVEGPVLFIANHLSVMETVVLPSIILPYRPLTFVVKQSLLEVPIFKHVLTATDPIAVTRTNPRHDLKTVLEQGVERLSRNFSIVIFPQTTRAPFDPDQFSSIGVKLAKRAQVKVVPLALLTDAWKNGRWVKDFGRIVPQRRVYFEFGAPISVEGKGNDEQQHIIDFIQSRLALWQEERRAAGSAPA